MINKIRVIEDAADVANYCSCENSEYILILVEPVWG